MNLTTKIKSFFIRYRHKLFDLGFFFFYLAAFHLLEEHNNRNFHMTTTDLDFLLPLVEGFVLPYYLWFPFMFFFGAWFFFKDDEDWNHFFRLLRAGMTTFLVFSALFPNAQDLRPTQIAGDGFFNQLLAGLYRIDTPTNVFPSIHVYNSLAIALCVRRSHCFGKNRIVQAVTWVLSITICLSTLLIKQHSILDMLGAILLLFITYPLIYRRQTAKHTQTEAVY